MKFVQEKKIMLTLRAVAFGLATLGASIAVAAQNAIQSINSSQQGGSDVIRIELAEPLLVVPSGFSLQAPARVAIDLPGVSNAIGKSIIEVQQGNVKSVNVAQAGDRTRLVLNLKQPSTYKAQLQGKTLVLVLDGTAPASAAPATGSAQGVVGDGGRFAENLSKGSVSIQGVDFRRAPDGAGRVIVDLASNQVGVDIRQQGQNLMVEFQKSSIPDSLRRRLDVADFGTPVQKISTTQVGDKVRMLVEPRGNWEHSAYQADNKFVLEVRTQVLDPNKLTPGPGYTGDKLSLNFQNIEIRALLQVIADFTNFNVVTSESVTGNVTLRLKDVPWDQALDIIMQAKSLDKRMTGNVMLIAPKDELAARDKAELAARKEKDQLEPLKTQSFQLNYSKAEAVAKGLSGEGKDAGGRKSGILSDRGQVIFESRTNQIFVSDIPSKLEEVQALISRIDIPVRQVLIEARIVEADDKFGKSLGARLGFNEAMAGRTNIGGNYQAVGYQTGQTENMTDFMGAQFVNLPAVGQGGNSPASFAVSLFNPGMSKFLNLEITALEADGRGKVVSSPRIVTADQIQASIKQGTRIPYQKATSSGATSVEFLDAVLMLLVTPQITPEGSVILNVEVTKDSVGTITAAGASVNTKSIKTQVLVENGGTVVIGGIYEQVDRTDVAKVPVLGDVPVLGHLFKTKTSTVNKTELLIFLTPKIVSERTAAR